MDNPEKLATYGTQKRRQTKQKHNTIRIGHHYPQTNTNNVNKTWFYLKTNTNNVNKTWALLLTTGGKEEPNIVFKPRQQRGWQ